jgi:hypothetical protein
VISVLIVMATVFLSTLYPSILASRLARPSKVTDFELPELSGDTVRLELPFTFNARDAQASCAFLAEYLEAHAEASAGGFSTENIRVRSTEDKHGPLHEISCRVWMAPYDFGVSQDMRFSMRESVGDTSSAILTIVRLSGDQGSWRRVNKRFLKDVRKQFLIWRSLSEPSRINYFNRAKAMSKKDERREA